MDTGPGAVRLKENGRVERLAPLPAMALLEAVSVLPATADGTRVVPRSIVTPLTFL